MDEREPIMTAHVGHQPAGASERSTAELIRQAAEQIALLIRDELRLARLEMWEKGRHLGRGAGMFGVSGVLALFGTGAVVTAAILALALVLPGWAAALIVGAVLLAAAGLLALLGRNQVRTAAPLLPQEASKSIRRNIDEVRERTGH